MLTLLQTINILNSAILFSKSQIKITKFNNLTLNVLVILQQLNFIDSFKLNENNMQCIIYLHSNKSSLIFQQIHSISTPKKFVYLTYSELVKLRTFDLTSEYIISSSHNHDIIMTSDEAIRHHSGGLVLLKLNF